MQGSLSALVGPCTDPPPAQAAAQPLRDARSALKAPLLPLLGGPNFSCCSSSQSKWPAFCSRSEGQASWMDFADEGRNWEGAELIPQLYAESSFTGTDSQPFLLSRAGEAQEAPVSRQGMILSHCNPQTPCTWNIPASRPLLSSCTKVDWFPYQSGSAAALHTVSAVLSST